MCSIIGVSGNWQEETLLNVFKWSRIRGLHSFGYTYIKKNNLITNKFLSFDDFCNSILEIRPEKFIAHFRYSTSGDYLKIENNQPIQLVNLSLVFNGVIDMSEKEEMEQKWDCKLITENDGELALIEYQKGNIIKLLRRKEISFSGLFLEAENKIVAIRNERRPMSIGNQNGCIYISSTSDILRRSGILNSKEINPYEQYIF
jgi:glutamine phosphoribosylpyrophosphate amidotransferase